MKDPIVITIIKSDEYLYASENVFIDSKNVTESYTKKSWWHSVSVKLGQVKDKKRKKEILNIIFEKMSAKRSCVIQHREENNVIISSKIDDIIYFGKSIKAIKVSVKNKKGYHTNRYITPTKSSAWKDELDSFINNFITHIT